MKLNATQTVKLNQSYNYFKNIQTMPIKFAYKLLKIGRASEENLDFYSARLNEILAKYAQKDENGNYISDESGTQYLIQDDKQQEAMAEKFELDNFEFEYPDVTFTLEELGNSEMNMEVLEGLFPFVED